MAAGANDSNGVYLYGEDDTIGLFSAFLNKLGNSISAVVTTLKSRIAAVEAKLAGSTATSYTPTLTNIVLGTGGTAKGRYTVLGSTVTCFVTITLGSGGSVGTGALYVGFPTTAQTEHSHIGTFFGIHSGSFSSGVVELDNSVRAIAVTAGGGIAGGGSPWAWANGDQLRLQFTYIKV